MYKKNIQLNIWLDKMFMKFAIDQRVQKFAKLHKAIILNIAILYCW